MTHARNPVVVIPARMAARRFPDKPLADLLGEPMIVHVWRRAVAADIGPVLVACGDVAIAEAIRSVGGEAVMTDASLPSGSDRVHAAIQQADPGRAHDAVINVQGDLPTLEPGAVAAALAPLAEPDVDIATLATRITEDDERTDPNVVKVVLALADGATVGRALYFSRATVPAGDGPLYHHIGLYAYRREALDRFVALPESGLERRERLEQLRALEAGMRIDAALVDSVPLGVDTPADLARARSILQGQSPNAETST